MREMEVFAGLFFIEIEKRDELKIGDEELDKISPLGVVCLMD